MTRRHASAAIVAFVAVTILGGACTRSSVDAPDVSAAQARHEVAHLFLERSLAKATDGGWYRTLDEMLPNVSYARATGEVVGGVATHVVLGEIVDVRRGKGFRVTNGDAPAGIPVDFGDSRARWWTAHATVKVERGLASSTPKEIEVVFPSYGPAGFATMRAGLESLGRVVLFLRDDSMVTAYDRDLFWVIEEDGMAVARVAADGTLHMDLMPEHRGHELLAATPTLRDLEAKAAAPRVVQMVGAYPHETRADGL
ncbi:MAG TPA: hypothetical protein VF230_02745 [Acidimicrobiales bacterium]